LCLHIFSAIHQKERGSEEQRVVRRPSKSLDSKIPLPINLLLLLRCAGNQHVPSMTLHYTTIDRVINRTEIINNQAKSKAFLRLMIGIAWDPVPDTSTYVKRQQQFEL